MIDRRTGEKLTLNDKVWLSLTRYYSIPRHWQRFLLALDERYLLQQIEKLRWLIDEILQDEGGTGDVRL